ncbi:zinc finger and SCAN domain-containing protein 26-like [Bombus huntii]|uniref:zinc finger and SCAN domain-containing protein 26-like n=1 Tax=Bombus huntii TaxID=85661 RepID=UPI0021A9A949|nr:zinc finger and SCAN domain-containing protein 26-like [Bombus huntii]
MAEKSKPPNPTQQLVLLCRRIPDQKNINRVPLDLKANSISERNAKKRRRFVRSSKKMNKSRTLKKSESNLTDSTTQNGTNVDLISNENIMSTSDCSNLVNSDSSLIETNNDTVGKIPDDQKINTVKRALISVKNPVTNEIKKMLVPTESTNTGRLSVIKNILIPVYDKSGVISNMKKVVLPIKQKSNLYETSKENSKMLIIDNTMQQMGNVQKEDTSTISIENELKGLENSKNPVAQVALNESRVQWRNRREKGKTRRDRITKVSHPRNIKFIIHQIYSCDKCNKWYPSKLLLEKHKITHEDYPYLQRPTCHLKYKRKARLKYHHIRMHSNVEPKFMCDHCGKRLKLKIDLVDHIEKTHLNARHVCKICGKIVENITHHEWQHDKTAKRNAFKYSCDVCRKKFSIRNHLDNHLLMHKDGFKCTLCDVFSSPYSLSSHKIMKHRRSSTCTICERSFPSTTNFYQHVLTHEEKNLSYDSKETQKEIRLTV